MVSGHDDWFADESIWKDLYPFQFPERAFAVADEQVEKILRLTGIGAGKVLDLCCGPGRHAVALAKRGFAVTAVDRTSFLLEHARARAAQANLPIEFVLEDMRQFKRRATFDLIINIFTSFGYFADQADDLRVLELVRENLRPGGAFVLEMVSKERLARAFQATTSTELPNGDVLFERHEIVDDWTRVRNRWTLMRSGSSRTFEFIHRIYSGQEMKNLLAAAGLAGAQVYGDLDGGSYGFDAQRLIAIARRPPISGQGS
jgi:SAM-dependent methyltransferase